MSDHDAAKLSNEVQERIRRDAATKDLTAVSAIARYETLDPSDLPAVRELLKNVEDLNPSDAANSEADANGSEGAANTTAADAPASEVKDTTDPEATSDDDYHVAIDPDRIENHYERARPVYETLAMVDEFPTMGLDGLSGWYITRDEPRVDHVEDGYTKRRRPASFDRDLDTVLERVDRTIYGLTTYKDPDALRRWTPARFDDETGVYEHKGGDNPTPRTEDLRAVSAWGDIDLCDHLKGQRGDLDEDTRETAEATLEAYAEEFGKLVGGTDAIYALDSVGGAYIFTAPEITMPIAEYVAEEYDEARAGTVLREVIDRSNEWLKTAQGRVEERVGDAADVIDPDWANNHNRKYKAPLAIHKDHDAVVTPIDPDDVEYQITRLDDVDEELVGDAEAWADRFTTLEHTDRVSHLVEQLFADEFEDADTWQDAIDSYVEAEIEAEKRRDELEQARQQSQERDRDLNLSEFDITPSISDVERAINDLDVESVADDTIVKMWTGRKSGLTDRSGSGKKAIVPTWADSYNSGNASYIDLEKGIFNDTDSGDHGTVVEMALIDGGGWAVGKIADGSDWARGVQRLRELGYDIPVWTPDAKTPLGDKMPYWALRSAAVALDVVDEDDLIEREGEDGGSYLGFPDAATYNAALKAVEDAGLSTGRTHLDHDRAGIDHAASGGQYSVEECTPPAYETETFDRETHWQLLQNERYDVTLDHNGPVMWADPAGSGKTTNALLGALDRDRRTAPLFDKHRKAREVQTDDALPDDWEPFHLRGGEQKRKPICMDADHDDEHYCPVHGDNSACPSICPIYDLESDADIRQRYDTVARELGDLGAHRLLAGDLPEHDEEGNCAWTGQFDGLESIEHVVGVHEYQSLKTVRGARDVLVDESPSSLRSTRHLSVEKLSWAANGLDDVADTLSRENPARYTAQKIADFVGEVVDRLTSPDTEASLKDIDPPEPVWNAYETYGDVAGNHIEREGPEEDWHIAEALAQVKVAFTETIVRRIRRDDWEGTPLCMDALLSALAEAGLPTDPVMRAVAVPATLTTCPWCQSDIESHNGARCCSSDDCHWHEKDHTITQRDGERARAQAHLDTMHQSGAGLVSESLPLPSELPDDPVILDATATPEKVAAIYGVDPDDIAVFGDINFEANMRTTQVLDGQYHASTIRTGMTDEEGEFLPREEWSGAADRIQTTIDTGGDLYDRPLFVVKKSLNALFEFPEHAEVLHYHATRGLNREECDAVFCIGAPHPDMEDLQREGELLAMGSDRRVGGEEHSTRRDAPNPPVYRKLNFEDDRGHGRAVPTKHYTGLVGDLFRENREKELVQSVHRARPLLAEDDPVDIFLLTNVPTSLPIDEVCSFKELTDPLKAMLPVRDGAFDLLEVVHDAVDGDAPDGFRAERLVDVGPDGELTHKVSEYHRLARLSGLEVSERTVRNYIDDLESVGLLHPEEYEQRAGVSYTADFATLKTALSVISSNGGFEVAAVRRFSALAGAAEGTLEWLRWAREALGLGGDRCEWDPPPNSG